MAPPATRAKAAATRHDSSDREPIMAYLRIRPHLNDSSPTSPPYLQPISSTSVRMSPPNGPSKNRLSSSSHHSSLYTFSHIFPPNTPQSDFFTRTTLPLVRDILDGQNALLFTYGVTNSGKTYTVQGGTEQGSAGILPRSLDVIFNSIKGLHSDGRYKPVRLHGIETSDPADTHLPTAEPALAQVLPDLLPLSSPSDSDIDPTVLKLDRNHEYSIWLSYAEVYNEKAYDLLESVADNNQDAKSGLPRPNHTLFLTRKALPVKPSPASDGTNAGKYIAGLRHFRIHSAAQAKALVKLGQLHRRVFGTLANSQSSRSHGVVTVKVVRGHRGERNDPTALQVSRLTLVDLAGSERTKHTHTTGDRLREAGSINKSLMVLGQCMEVMRANQKRVAQSLAGARADTRDVRRGLAVVPFRHSKLTEVLMDYFVGDGKAIMIVNVNPYDTGFDENSHVMKFAALAREVYTTPAHAPVQRAPSQTKAVRGKLGPPTATAPVRRKVTLSTGGPGRKYSEAHLEVLEEDEEMGEEGENDDEPTNPLIDALFDEVENLRMQLFESEMRCAIIEAETREEVMKEMEERMQSVERMYARRLMNEVERNELKTDAKIDMLHQSGMFGKNLTMSVDRSGDDVEGSTEEEGDESMEIVTSDEESDGGTGTETSMSPSPLAGKSKGMQAQYREIREFVPDGPACLPLPSDCSDVETVDSEDEDGTEDFSQTTEETEEEEEDEGDDDEKEEWVPPVAVTPKARASKAKASISRFSSVSGSSVTAALPKTRASKGKVSKLAKEMQALSVAEESDSDLSAYLLPSKKARRVIAVEEVSASEEERLGTIKKRQLVKQRAAAKDDIEQTPMGIKSRGRQTRK